MAGAGLAGVFAAAAFGLGSCGGAGFSAAGFWRTGTFDFFSAAGAEKKVASKRRMAGSIFTGAHMGRTSRAAKAECGGRKEGSRIARMDTDVPAHAG